MLPSFLIALGRSIEEFIQRGDRLLSRVVDGAFRNSELLSDVFHAVAIEDHLKNLAPAARKLVQQLLDQVLEFRGIRRRDKAVEG